MYLCCIFCQIKLLCHEIKILKFFILLSWDLEILSHNIYLSFQDSHNQAGIAYNGGLIPLLKLLDSKNGSLQHNAAFALYGLADNEVT